MSAMKRSPFHNHPIRRRARQTGILQSRLSRAFVNIFDQTVNNTGGSSCFPKWTLFNPEQMCSKSFLIPAAGVAGRLRLLRTRLRSTNSATLMPGA
jgi:hypothetical protein